MVGFCIFCPVIWTFGQNIIRLRLYRLFKEEATEEKKEEEKNLKERRWKGEGDQTYNFRITFLYIFFL